MFAFSLLITWKFLYPTGSFSLIIPLIVILFIAMNTALYGIAGVLLLIGVALWVLTWATNRGIRSQRTGFRDIDSLEEQ